jgi:hypothetical protein
VGMRKTQDRALHHRRTRYKPGFAICRCAVCRKASTLAEEAERAGRGKAPAMGSPVPGCEYRNSEKAFAEAWEKEQQRSYGMPLVQALMVVHRPGEVSGRVAFWLTPRERVIVASIVQWLGTNVGFAFLREALRRCGYRITEEAEPEEKWAWRDELRRAEERTRAMEDRLGDVQEKAGEMFQAINAALRGRPPVSAFGGVVDEIRQLTRDLDAARETIARLNLGPVPDVAAGAVAVARFATISSEET